MLLYVSFNLPFLFVYMIANVRANPEFVCRTGRAQSIRTAGRIALDFMQSMSGIATLTKVWKQSHSFLITTSERNERWLWCCHQFELWCCMSSELVLSVYVNSPRRLYGHVLSFVDVLPSIEDWCSSWTVWTLQSIFVACSSRITSNWIVSVSVVHLSQLPNGELWHAQWLAIQNVGFNRKSNTSD